MVIQKGGKMYLVIWTEDKRCLRIIKIGDTMSLWVMKIGDTTKATCGGSRWEFGCPGRAELEASELAEVFLPLESTECRVQSTEYRLQSTEQSSP